MKNHSSENTENRNMLDLVEPLCEEDATAVALLEKTCFSLPWSEKQLRQAMAHQAFQIIGIKTGSRALGAYVSFYHLKEEIEIVNIATSPKLRRKGMAFALMRTLIGEALSLGVSRILLEVKETNQPAIALYQSFGFKPIGVRKGYYRDTGEDAIVLELPLNQ